MLSVLLSLGGLILTGALLNALQKWEVFVRIPQLFILVPTLLGLKGNLEMNLASRLSTASNVGLLDKPISRWQLVLGNMALVQVGVHCLFREPIIKIDAKETALICASGILTASVASLFLGNVMSGTVVVCRILGVDPDNIATPVAASLGDLITLLLLAGLSSLLNKFIDTSFCVLLIVFILCLLPMWVFVVLRNTHVKDVLMTGWSSLFTAMMISSVGGIVLGNFLDQFRGLAVVVPVMNGICGNLACIYASKISTELHEMPLGKLPSRLETLSSMRYAIPTALFLINIPAQITFLFLVQVFRIGEIPITLWFLTVYLSASGVLVVLLLRLTAWLALELWRRGLDPDNYIFSLVTAVGDVAGTILVVEGFRIIRSGA
ncbi:hypothetical protein HDU84_000452 [Entophlyctis sp. JEL0112]|nr:hypothetical protein HDU84_000452 [Entophlyctis sp. JEL0112]